MAGPPGLDPEPSFFFFFFFAKSVPVDTEYSIQCVEYPILALFPRPFLLEPVAPLMIEDLRPPLHLADTRRPDPVQFEGEPAAQSSIARDVMANATSADVLADDDTEVLPLGRVMEGTSTESECCMERAIDSKLDDWGEVVDPGVGRLALSAVLATRYTIPEPIVLPLFRLLEQSSDIKSEFALILDEVYERTSCRDFWDQPDGATALQGAVEDIIHHLFDE